MSLTDAELLECVASTWSGDPTTCRWCDAPLPKGRRRWCSTECSDANGANHWWYFARYAALRRDAWACVTCGIAAAPGVTLEVHHKTPIRGRHSIMGCHHHLSGLVTLCGHRRDGIRSCHHRIHHGEKFEQLALEAA